MNEGQKVQIGPEQVVKAANAGLTLLNTPGAVNVPGPMAISGDIQLLNAVLTAIVQGQVVLGNPEVEKKESKKEPLKEETPTPILKEGAGVVTAET